MQILRTTILTVASLLVGIVGILLNCTSACLASADDVLGVLVLVSIAMVAIGYLPLLKQWSGHRWATRLMNVGSIGSIGSIVYVLCIVASTNS